MLCHLANRALPLVRRYGRALNYSTSNVPLVTPSRLPEVEPHVDVDPNIQPERPTTLHPQSTTQTTTTTSCSKRSANCSRRS